MKKILYSFVVLLLFLSVEITSQILVTGKLVNENGEGLSGVFLQLYISPNVYNTTSMGNGSFSFAGITDVEEEGELPSGYSVTNNFPNPFNPTTRLGITLPNNGNVKIAVYNLLGQKVIEDIANYFNAGTNYVDIELNGLSNGFYVARISIDEKYTITKKMMLVYGTQHLSATGSGSSSQLIKSGNALKKGLTLNIDSLVATNSIIGRKTFTNLPSIFSDSLNLGNLTIQRYCPGTPTVSYAGKTYNTVLIGSQCWLKENLDVGTMIPVSQNAANNGVIEKYCYDNNPANCEIYGGLYQWDEAMQYVITPGAQEGICPSGWHIPTLAEFQTLSSTAGGDGNALKAVGQGSGGGAGTNTSGFSALLAGYRSTYGSFSTLGGIAGFWSSTEFFTSQAYDLYLNYINSVIDLYSDSKYLGYSVRCVKD